MNLIRTTWKGLRAAVLLLFVVTALLPFVLMVITAL